MPNSSPNFFLEVPSIVVHNGSSSAPGSPKMDHPARSASKQSSITGEDDMEEEPALVEAAELGLPSSSSPSPFPASLPITPSPPSPAVSPSTPPVSTPSGSPAHLRSSTPSSNDSGKAVSPSSFPEGARLSGGEDSGMVEVFECPHGVPSRSKSLELTHQRSSTDSEKDLPVINSRNKGFHANKLKLLQRSHAMREDTSPPPPMDMMEGFCPQTQMIHMGPFSSSNNLTVCQGPPMGCPPGVARRRLRHQGTGSSQGSFDGSSPCLSRDSSTEYTDSTGVDLLQFIVQTLHKNQKDRMLLLKIERELINIVKDPKRTHHKFPQMSSYQRMLVHRCAAYFGLDHNVDQVGTCVIVNKTRNTRIPETRFKDHIRDELLPPDEPRRSILRRGFASFEDNFRSADLLHSLESRRSKSYEEREEEYEKARRRIFSNESFSSMEGMCDSPGSRRFLHYPFERHYRRDSQDDPRWLDSRQFSLTDARQFTLIDPESHRKYYDNHRIRPCRLLKGESFESQDVINARSLRPPVFKSHSFGGYSGGVTVLARGDSVVSNPTRLTKQDSTGSRFSDHSSSSGYKTQRQDTSSTNVSNTLSTTPSPTAGQHQHPSFGQHAGIWGGGEGDCQPVMWAVTDMEAVPSGALLINPQTGHPYTNPDGTLYRYDPNNPIPLIGKPYAPQKISSFKDKDMDKRLEDVTEIDTQMGSNVQLAQGSGESSIPQDSQLTDSAPDSHPMASSSDTLQEDEGKAESVETDDGSSEEMSGKEKDIQGKLGCKFDQDDDSHNYQYFIHTQQPNGRSYSRESVGDLSKDFRDLSLSGGGEGAPEITSPNASSSGGTPIPHGYVMPRHQYPQTVYYVPPANVSTGAMKYVYPQYPMAHSHTGTVQPTSHPTQPSVQPPMGAPIHPHLHNPIGDAGTQVPAGYLPGSYTMVAYPPGGVLSTASSTTGGHEAGGTTYYCQMPGAAALGPGAAAGSVGPPSGPPGAGSGSLQQYSLPPTSTSSTTFSLPLGFYSPSGMGANGIYQTPGIQGFHPGIYGASPHGGVPAPTAVSFRAPTPPHTPSTQAVTMPLAFNTPAGGVPPAQGVGGQYITVLPHHQPPAPSTHSPHFQTFFRPSLQMLSGSSGTPLPQYSGVSAPLPAPPSAVSHHPPVSAKPFPGGSGEFLELGAGNEDGKWFAGSGGALTPSHYIPLTGAPPSHFLPRPYSFMQSSLSGGGARGFRPSTPILISPSVTQGSYLHRGP